MPIVVIKILIALGLDQWLGEPRRYHPLVGFGQLAGYLENRLNQPTGRLPNGQRLRGLAAWLLMTLPVPFLIIAVEHAFGPSLLMFSIDAVLLYFCIGRRSLREHSERVASALESNDLDGARHHTSMIVSRECDNLEASGCARATIESVLENGNDSLFATLFWFVCFGSAGAVFYRLANTLDAMWGYRNQRYLHFGWAAARLDDMLNYIPARICALCYSLAGNRRLAWSCWKRQAQQLSSPNGGPVMCAGAGALNLRLGGPATYHGKTLQKPWFGGDRAPTYADIVASQRLLDRGLVVFLLSLLVLELVI